MPLGSEVRELSTLFAMVRSGLGATIVPSLSWRTVFRAFGRRVSPSHIAQPYAWRTSDVRRLTIHRLKILASAAMST
jgi:DNA-binding transcriptional LysR family regulator